VNCVPLKQRDRETMSSAMMSPIAQSRALSPARKYLHKCISTAGRIK
jgi:hypothetical protein